MPTLIKALPYLLGVALLVGLYSYGDHHGHAASDASWQARWTARDLSETQAKDAALAAQKAVAETHAALDLKVIHDKDEAIASALAANADLSQRLSRAIAAYGSRAVPGTPSTGGPVAAGNGDACTQGVERANQRVYDAAIKCAATLTALQNDCR